MLHQHYRSLRRPPASHELQVKLETVGSATGTAFDDWSDLSLSPSYSLSQVTIHYTDSLILGLSTHYTDHYTHQPSKSAVHFKETSAQSAVLSLCKDEFLVTISGLIQDGITRLRLETNTGRFLDVGSPHGSSFTLPISQCHGLSHFSGHFSTSLHSLSGAQRPIFMRQSIDSPLSLDSLKGPNLGYNDVFPRVPENSGIRRICIRFTNTHIEDMEVIYWDTTQLHHLGNRTGSVCDVFDIDRNDELVRICGTVDQGVVTSVGVKTGKGRERNWGQKRGVEFVSEVKKGWRTAGVEVVKGERGVERVKIDTAYRPPRAIVTL